MKKVSITFLPWNGRIQEPEYFLILAGVVSAVFIIYKVKKRKKDNLEGAGTRDKYGTV